LPHFSENYRIGVSQVSSMAIRPICWLVCTCRIFHQSPLELGAAQVCDALALSDELPRVDLEQPQALRRTVQVLVAGETDLAGRVSVGRAVKHQVQRSLDLLAVAGGVDAVMSDGRLCGKR